MINIPLLHPELNKVTTENSAIRLKQANLATKGDIADFEKKADLDDEIKKLNAKVTSNKSKHLLFENEFKNYKLNFKNWKHLVEAPF